MLQWEYAQHDEFRAKGTAAPVYIDLDDEDDLRNEQYECVCVRERRGLERERERETRTECKRSVQPYVSVQPCISSTIISQRAKNGAHHHTRMHLKSNALAKGGTLKAILWRSQSPWPSHHHTGPEGGDCMLVDGGSDL